MLDFDRTVTATPYDTGSDERDLRFLADLSTGIFSMTLDVAGTLTQLSTMLVPRVAVACRTEVFNGSAWVVADAFVGADGRVFTTIADVTPELVEDERIARFPDAGVRGTHGMERDDVATLEVPLGRRGRLWGRLMLDVDAPGSTRLVALGAEIGRRASIAIDCALLYQAEQTERMRAEERARRVSVLGAVTRELSRAVTVEEIADVFVQRALSAVGASKGSLYLLDEPREFLDVVRIAGYDDDIASAWQRIPVALDAPIVAPLRTGDAVWIRSADEFVERYPEQAELVRRGRGGASAAIPLVSDDRVIGVVGLSFDDAQPFEADDREFIRGMVDQCAHAIERARLYDRATEANKAKDRFLAILSHELRTPLAPVLPAVHALEEEQGLSEIGRSMVEIIRRNVNLEVKLIDDLLDVARIANGKLALHRAQLDMHATIRSVVSICRAELDEKSLGLELRLDATAVTIDGDATRLHQALWNLLRNAIKFTGAGGTIVVSTRTAGARIEISIADDGIGIDPEMLGQIFDPFMQGGDRVHRQFGGMGLGLSISRAVVALHGGELTARSGGAGKGAEFVIALETVERIAAVVEPEPIEAELAEAAVCRVLLVDDHEDTQFVLRRMLERSGFRVTTASSCAAARQLAVLGDFDVLVSDIGLPDGTGYELLADIRLLRLVPAIAISGFGTDEDLARSRAVGFRTHLTKPVEHTVLVDAIRRALA